MLLQPKCQVSWHGIAHTATPRHIHRHITGHSVIGRLVTLHLKIGTTYPLTSDFPIPYQLINTILNSTYSNSFLISLPPSFPLRECLRLRFSMCWHLRLTNFCIIIIGPGKGLGHLPRKFLILSSQNGILANCLIYSQALLEYVILFCCWSFWCVLLARCYLSWNSRKIRCSFSLSS